MKQILHDTLCFYREVWRKNPVFENYRIGWHIQQEWDKIQAIAKNQSISACKFGGSVLAPLCSDDPI